MTREEALNKAIGILTYNQVNFCKSKEAVVNMNEIIEALEKIDQEQCGDCISRDAMWEVLQILYGTEGELVEELMSLPPVLPMPKMGKWVYDKERDSYKCSLCGFFCAEDKLGAIPTNYCANCGSYNGGEG